MGMVTRSSGALAVRTMGCIRVDKIVEYLCEPLRKCLTDQDPYVRKTAVMSCLKLHTYSGDHLASQLIGHALSELIEDGQHVVEQHPHRVIAEIVPR